MSNHVHLIVETPEPNLSEGIQLFHGRYARYFNDRHGRSGHVFQGRFGSNLIQTDAHLLTAVGYVAMNPVDAGLCVDPEDWRWGSQRATGGGTSVGWLDVDGLLDYLAAWGGDPRRTYRDAVEARRAPAPG
jgi:REP-associated tyrosine transposase